MTKKKIEIKTEKEWDKTFQMISWWKTEDVRNAKIMVVGAGALGNEVLKNLALLNVGNILIVDFDHIEYSNLSRSVLFRESDVIDKRLKSDVAAERIKEINPNIKTQTINGDIMVDVGIGVLRRMNVVIGCLDNRLARLFINRHCYKVEKTWVDGAIENLAGELNVYMPGVSCYESQLSDQEWQNIRHKMGCPDVARRNSLQGRIPTTPISSSIIAAMQVQEALKVVMGNVKHSMAGKKFLYEGMNNIIMTYETAVVNEDVESALRYEDIIEAKELRSDSTIAEALKWLSSHLKVDNPKIEYPPGVILEITMEKSEKVVPLVISKAHFSDDLADEYSEHQDESIIFSKMTYEIDKDFPNQDLKLSDVGIPPLQILSVQTDDDLFFVELTGDEDFLNFS